MYQGAALIAKPSECTRKQMEHLLQHLLPAVEGGWLGSTGVMLLKQQQMASAAPQPHPASPSAFPLPAQLPCERGCD